MPTTPVFPIVAFAILAAVASTRAADPDDFAVYNYDFQNDGSVDLPGRLFVPDAYDPAETWDLVVFLHGAGEVGTDNIQQVDGNIDNLLAAARARGFFLYAPQAPNWWSFTTVRQAMRMAEKLTGDFAIDPTRVYVTGLSMGGGGSWEAITNFEGGLAGAIPICGTTSGSMVYPHAVGVPIWNFHARNDGTVSVNQSRIKIEAVLTSGGFAPPTYPTTGDFFFEANSLRLTEYATGGHGIWGRVYNTTAAYDWLFDLTNPRAALSASETIRIDLGSNVIANPDPDGHHWNSTTYGLERTLAPAIPFLRTSGDRSTGVSLDVIRAFTGRSTSGDTTGTALPPEVAGDSWIVGSWSGHAAALSEAGTIRLTGLTPGDRYRVEVFGSHQDDDGGRGRMARYTIGAEDRDLETALNTDQTVVFESVVADADGGLDLTLTVAPDGSSRWVSLTALWVTAPSAACPGDVNDDGATDVGDFADLAAGFGSGPGATHAMGDLTGDGYVDVFDFAELAADFDCSMP